MKFLFPWRRRKSHGLKPAPYANPIRHLRPIRSGNSRHRESQAMKTDLYHWLLVLSWPKFLAIIGLFYFGLNVFFALIFFLIGGGIANAQPGSFLDLFFFSIQTLSTVGYGAMYPKTVPAQIVVSVEIFVGLISLAILTGLMFSRFAKPTSRVLFSEVAVVCPFENIPTLMFRTANQRDNRILEAQIRVSLVRDEQSQEGHKMRRFYDLNLLRSHTPVFGLSWLVMHPIDSNSPLYGILETKNEQLRLELWISFTGLDESFSQTIHSRYVYEGTDIHWQHRFVDIFHQTPEGQWFINMDNFHLTEPYRQ
ncbi:MULTISPECIES: ion channel [Synechocystis]|uniref:ATP-sensitive inward rectifier potassium channel 10 n=1 Tax=Synechocystis salina LEGE 00031 TaxID=1828736 RepID=A0ABR9VQ25_9SYNC|nr:MULTISPECIES: ion channel [Synechocystis]MBE9195643.1 ATP-sensitive inward rectifier potassium channel 10 [Synechocystis sp. LEGE 06083]MBE9242880.1 ATP-sensitive inward rectifier potassium channel 10 [Synechocystis salina LEGE 00041]MBE9253444.1 ATP-sensitive inward rectifier potassium channel 10 [Synechocystis salina LEGE 00031]